MDGEAAALAAIRAALSEPVDYLAAPGATAVVGLPVIWSDVGGDPFQGPGNTVRTKTAEITYGSVAARPNKRAVITRKGKLWRVDQVVDRDDVEAWIVTLEVAA